MRLEEIKIKIRIMIRMWDKNAGWISEGE